MFCKGITKKGTNCTRRVGEGFEYCFQHDKTDKTENKDEPQKGGDSENKEHKPPKIPCSFPVGDRTCKKFSYDGSGRCSIHKDKEFKANPRPPPKKRCIYYDYLFGYCPNLACKNSIYCTTHKHIQYLCNYKFANGTWCNYYAKNGGKYCPLHSGDYKAPPPPPVQKPLETYMDSLKYFELPESTNYMDIKKKYRELALKHHPDKGGNAEDFKILQKHYDILSKKYNVS